MHACEDSMKTWKELMAQRGQMASPGPRCIDWCEQPPRKRAKPAVRRSPVQTQPDDADADSAAAQVVPQLSHKVVEKRRRDRMNQALGSLSQLIPSAYLKQGQSRVEKAEIIELAAQHLLALTSQLRKCHTALGQHFPASDDACCIGKFYQGFRESTKATMSFLTEQEGFSTTDTLCCRLRTHLHTLSQKHLPNKDELTSAAEHPSQQIRSQSRGGSCSTDEAPPSCDSGGGGSSCDGDHAAAAEAASAAAGLRRDPKSAFKLRLEAESGPAAKAAVAAGLGDEDEQLLPGFVLHESGTHYLPLVVPPSALGIEVCATAGPAGISDGADGAQPSQVPLLHPVSIPVNFRATRFVRPLPPKGGQSRRAASGLRPA